MKITKVTIPPIKKCKKKLETYAFPYYLNRYPNTYEKLIIAHPSNINSREIAAFVSEFSVNASISKAKTIKMENMQKGI